MIDDEILLRVRDKRKERLLREGVDDKMLEAARQELEYIYQVPFLIGQNDEGEIEVWNASYLTVARSRQGDTVDLTMNPEGIYRGADGIRHLMESPRYDHKMEGLRDLLLTDEVLRMRRQLLELEMKDQALYVLAQRSLQANTVNVQELQGRDPLLARYEWRHDYDRDNDGIPDRLDLHPDTADERERGL